MGTLFGQIMDAAANVSRTDPPESFKEQTEAQAVNVGVEQTAIELGIEGAAMQASEQPCGVTSVDGCERGRVYMGALIAANKELMQPPSQG